jgi:hypothetical protein
MSQEKTAGRGVFYGICAKTVQGEPIGTFSYKYGDLVIQVGGVSNLRQQYMVMSPVGLGPSLFSDI